MSIRKTNLDGLRIPKPCSVEWDRMAGSEEVRYCNQCDRLVYNLSKMTRSRAEAIVSAARGELCARVMRRADGTVVTEEARPALHLVSRRASPVAAAVVTAMLGVGGSASPITAPQPPAFASSPLETGAKKPEAQPQAPVVGQAALQQNEDKSINAIEAEEPLALSGAVAFEAVEPLRKLYFDSDLIVVASVGQSVPLETETYGDMVKTALHVSSTIKGKSRKRVVYVYHWEAGDNETRYPRGESLLFFLARRDGEEGGGYKVNVESYGIKKLSAADLSVYIRRMRELESLGEHRRDDAREVVEWLVRCAEEPATRWEGSYELAQSLENLERNRTETEGEASPPHPSGGSELAALLTDNQKERLMSALFRTDPASERDAELIKLARLLRDERLAPYLVSQLRRMEDDPPYFAVLTMMIEIGAVLKDEKLSSLAQEYFRNTYFSEHETESKESLESEESEESEEPDAVEESRAAEPAQSDESPRRRAMSIEQARRERSAILKKFLSSVERRMKEMESKARPD